MPVKVVCDPNVKIDRVYVRNYLNFLSNQLDIYDQRDKITIKFNKISPNRHLGDARPHKVDGYLINVSNHFYTNELLDTIAHEMIHIKQFIKGELSYSSNNNFMWMGEECLTYEKDRKIYKLYKQFPWEIEAFSKSKDLVKMFLESYQEKSTY